MSVGENIAYFRKKLGLTQEMLSSVSVLRRKPFQSGRTV